ncbi:MAG: hypothetical protein ABSA23_12375 [Anaerolineales bacterium]|jgi:hypothetical protein
MAGCSGGCGGMWPKSTIYGGLVEGCHWPELDSDIEMDAFKHPERSPHKFKRND